MALSERERFEEYIRRSHETPVRDVFEIMDEFTDDGADTMAEMLDGWDRPPTKERRLRP